jgi:hypothetical protein
VRCITVSWYRKGAHANPSFAKEGGFFRRPSEDLRKRRKKYFRLCVTFSFPRRGRQRGPRHTDPSGGILGILSILGTPGCAARCTGCCPPTVSESHCSLSGSTQLMRGKVGTRPRAILGAPFKYFQVPWGSWGS